MRARRRLFAIVTSALTGALLLAAPATHASAADPDKDDKSTDKVASKAGAALEETSDLFGDLGGKVEKTLSHSSSLSTDLRRGTSLPLGESGGVDKKQKSSKSDATKLTKLVGGTAGTVVNSVDGVLDSLD